VSSESCANPECFWWERMGGMEISSNKPNNFLLTDTFSNLGKGMCQSPESCANPECFWRESMGGMEITQSIDRTVRY
jgi:hypothetical protein